MQNLYSMKIDKKITLFTSFMGVGGVAREGILEYFSCSLDPLRKCPQWSWLGQAEPGAGNSLWDSHMDGSKPAAWMTTC